MSLNTFVVVLIFLTIHERSFAGDPGVNLRCRCITKERKPIGRHIAVLEVHPVTSHCAEVQIIATLKKNNTKVCIDPDAPWIKIVLKNRRARQKAEQQNSKL